MFTNNQASETRIQMTKHFALVPLLGLLLSSAAPGQTEKTQEPPRIVRTLEMDPESPQQFRGWWVSPNALLLIEANGGYQLWKGKDRFTLPQQMGRWHQRNHAVILLESYAIPRKPASRFSLWLKNDSLMADLVKSGSATKKTVFLKVAQPPPTPEDAIIGAWVGPGGQLMLNQDLSYEWTVPNSTLDAPATLASQRGHWSYREKQLRMIPLSKNQVPVIDEIVIDEKKRITTMRTSHGDMYRVAPAAPAIDSQPLPAEPTPSTQTKG